MTLIKPPNSYKAGDFIKSATYSPACFDAEDMQQAREIILTEEGGLSSEHRWQHETPYLGRLIGQLIQGISEHTVFLDYGCGVGRLARELIRIYGCRVVGADISTNMRALAPVHVDSPLFMVAHPHLLDSMGFKADIVLAIWVLQHCFRVEDDLACIRRALKPGGFLFVVNENVRVVPTEEGVWVHDRINQRELLDKAFSKQIEGKLDPKVVSQELSDRTFCGLYRKA